MKTHNTKYGQITLYKNDCFIGKTFDNGKYWDEDTLIRVRPYIDPNRNILEIGGHCGTSSIPYAGFINRDKRVYVYEPQKNMYQLLVHNIEQNKLQDKIIPHNLGVFCYHGIGFMSNWDLVNGSMVSKRYHEEIALDCNFGGIGLGRDGELVMFTTIDKMNLPDIGYIHCDAQGSENFIFSKAIDTITRHRPVILYENNELYERFSYDDVCRSYPEYGANSRFNIADFCMEKLNYSKVIRRFNGGQDDLLIP